MNCSRVWLLLLLVAVTFPLANTAQARRITNPAIGFGFDLPDDWREIPAADVDATIRKIAQPGKVQYVGGYEPASHSRNFQYPYMLIQTIPYPPGMIIEKVTEADLRKVVAGITGTTESQIRSTMTPVGESLIGGLGEKSASYFTSPPGFVMDFNESVNSIGLVHDHGVGLLGRDHGVVIHIYSLESDYAALGPTVGNVSTSFRLDGTQQVSMATGIVPFKGPAVIIVAAIVVTVLVFAAVGIGLLVWFLTRKKQPGM